MRALVTGATGFIGRHLVAQIAEPVVLSRDPSHAREVLGDVEVHRWAPEAGPPPAEAFGGVEAVFHLAGEPVAQGRWTAAKKHRIRESRVAGTSRLVERLASLDRRPRVLVSASAVGYYGSRGDELLDEAAAAGDDFLAEVCRAWEAASAPARSLGLRVVNPRIGIVLGADGGALAKMLLPFKLGLGGRLASGNQWMPWIHVDDLVGLLVHAVRHDQIDGPLNAVAPAPVTNRRFTSTLAAVLRRPAVLPAPALGLRLVLGQFAEVLLASQRVEPGLAQRTGYAFRYPELKPALEALVGALGQRSDLDT